MADGGAHRAYNSTVMLMQQLMHGLQNNTTWSDDDNRPDQTTFASPLRSKSLNARRVSHVEPSNMLSLNILNTYEYIQIHDMCDKATDVVAELNSARPTSVVVKRI